MIARLVRAATVAVALAPSVALACPSCAGNSGNTATRLVLIGSFALLPFAIVGIVWRIVRRLDPPSGPPPSDPT